MENSDGEQRVELSIAEVLQKAGEELPPVEIPETMDGENATSLNRAEVLKKAKDVLDAREGGE